MDSLKSEMKKRYDALQAEIKTLCLKNKRPLDSVKLMLVSKTVPVERIQEAIDFGHCLFGENKVQELSEKEPIFRASNAEFHFIGHLQTNKVKKCIEHASMIHSLDRLSLALELDKHLQKLGKTMDILIQVNTSKETSKFGVEPDGLLKLVREIAPLSSLKIKGLMTLAKFSSEEEIVRPCFQLLRELSAQVRNEGIPGVSMSELSMGMSSDYKIAIQEGATIIRVGTAIFGKRNLPDSHYWPET